MFVVYDTGRRADHFSCAVGKDWDTCEYDKFDDAVAYAKAWLGELFYDPCYEWEVGSKFYYGGCGDFVTILQE